MVHAVGIVDDLPTLLPRHEFRVAGRDEKAPIEDAQDLGLVVPQPPRLNPPQKGRKRIRRVPAPSLPLQSKRKLQRGDAEPHREASHRFRRSQIVRQADVVASLHGQASRFPDGFGEEHRRPGTATPDDAAEDSTDGSPFENGTVDRLRTRGSARARSSGDSGSWQTRSTWCRLQELGHLEDRQRLATTVQRPWEAMADYEELHGAVALGALNGLAPVDISAPIEWS